MCIGTDLMVGFPGEDGQRFAQTRAVVADLPLAYFHVFSYSARPGTAAIRLKFQVPAQTIKERSANLSELSQVKRAEFYQRFIGQNVPVLFESSESVGWWGGLTDNYIRVRVPSTAVLANETGQKNEPAKLIAPMLARFMATDRAFTKARKTLDQPSRLRAQDSETA